jgi:hypothetical protein
VVKLTMEDIRDQLAREVLGDVLTSSSKLPVERPDGAHPIVVALADELLVDVWPRVDEAGRSANLFVRMNDGTLVLLEARYAVKSASAHDLGSEPLEQGHTIGMLVELASKYSDGVTFRTTPLARISSFPGTRSREIGYVEVETFAA